MKPEYLIIGALLLVILLMPSNADANPGNVQPLSDDSWLLQNGVASNGLSTFPSWATVAGVRAAAVNAISLYDQGNTTYQAFGDAWSGGTPGYADAIAQTNGAQASDTFTINTPIGLAALLHGVFVAEATTDPTNYAQRFVGATWGMLS